MFAEVAQLVEHAPEERGVTSSNLVLGTTKMLNMENQELSKKLTPEENEQQNKNLEQQEETKENPVEEDSAVRLADINEDISKKEENIKSTQSKIDDIRGQLGLPPSDEVPPSIKNTQDSIGKLNQEKSQIEGKNPNEATERSEETKRFEGNLKTALDDISTKSKTMLDALYEIQQDRLTSLQSNENFQMMASSIKNLKNFESKVDINSVTELVEDVNKLSRLFDEIKIQQSSAMKENPQNLEKLVFGAKSFSSSVEESGRKLPIEMGDKQMESKSKELRRAMQKLSEQSQKLWMLAVKMRENSR